MPRTTDRIRQCPLRVLLRAILALAGSVAGLTRVPALSAQAAAPLRGTVIDAVTRSPIPDAVITILRGDSAIRSLRSGADGTWEIALGGGTAPALQLRARRVGYAASTVVLRTSASGAWLPVTIALAPVPVSLDATVVTAARRPQQLKDTPVATQLITKDEIERTGASDLASVLDEQVGIVPSSGVSGGSSVLLQGLGQERVLVLLDGQPIEGRLSGTFDLSRIPTSVIDHVEIVEGPQSTLYGSQAMGGVINIITTHGMSDHTDASAQVIGGSQGRLDASAQLRGGTTGDAGTLTYAANLGHRDISIMPGESNTNSAFARRWDALGNVHWAHDSAFSATASAMYVTESQQWQSPPTTFAADNTQLDVHAGTRWQWNGQQLAPTFALSQYDHRPFTPGADTVDVTGSDVHEVQRDITGSLLYSAGVGPHTVEAGVDAHHETISSARVTDGSRAATSLEPFLQTTLAFGPVQVVPGLRLTWSDQWGTHWTPRLAALWRPVPSLALRAGIGQGFRAPDFKELYIDFLNTAPDAGYGVQGNPDLRPETSRNASASVEWAGTRVYSRIQGFDTKFDNFIDYEYLGMNDGILMFTYGNIDDGHVRGLEWDGGLVVGAARFDAGYSLTKATQSSTGQPLLGIPHETGRLSGTYAFGPGPRLSLTGLYTGAAPIGQDQSGGYVMQTAFTRLDVLVSQPLPNGFSILVGADNLFNAHPQNWSDASERRLYTGVRWSTALGGNASQPDRNTNAEGRR